LERGTAAVIFDMDGVLLDSEPLHYQALSRVLGAEGHAWSEKDNERLLGTTVTDSFRIIAESVPLARPASAYIPIYDRAVVEVLSQPLEPSPGARDLLNQLRGLGLPLAVASSSLRSWIDATLRSLNIAGYFSAIVSGEDVENGKPAPDIYLRAAELLGVAPACCTAIEDAPNGILSAKRAGLRVIALRTPHTSRLSLEGADITVDCLEDIDVTQLDL